MIELASPRELWKLRATGDYLFGRGSGEALFPEGVEVWRSRGRIRQVWFQGEPLCSLRAQDGMIVLNRAGARRLHRALEYPRRRVVVRGDAAEFVSKGKTVFCKHVLDADPEIRPGEEVLVVEEEDRLCAVGKAMLSGFMMKEFKTGQAVKVRRGMGGK